MTEPGGNRRLELWVSCDFFIFLFFLFFFEDCVLVRVNQKLEVEVVKGKKKKSYLTAAQ